jgi:hypothetical protein
MKAKVSEHKVKMVPEQLPYKLQRIEVSKQNILKHKSRKKIKQVGKNEKMTQSIFLKRIVK